MAIIGLNQISVKEVGFRICDNRLGDMDFVKPTLHFKGEKDLEEFIRKIRWAWSQGKTYELRGCFLFSPDSNLLTEPK